MKQVVRTPDKFDDEIKRATELSLIDRILEPIAPRLVGRRMSARVESCVKRIQFAYAASNLPGTSYQRQGVLPLLQTEEAEMWGFNRFQMIAEARDQYRNMPIIRALVDGLARRAVGTGINPVIETEDKDLNHLVKRAWEEFCKKPEITGRFDMDAICEQAIKSTLVDGDLGVIKCNTADGFKLQLVESDVIAETNRVNIGLDTINTIGGVDVDWDTMTVRGYMVGKRGVGGLLLDSEMVSVNDMILLFRKQRVDQFRGIPLLAPVLQTSRDLDKYLNATRIQANIAATFGVMIKRDQGAMLGYESSKPSANGEYRTQELKTGRIWHLNPQESIECFKPDVPGPQFDSFSKFLVRIIAIGAGTSYEWLMQDYGDMSFSSGKTTLLDVNLTLRQWVRWLANELLEPIFKIWYVKEVAEGKLPWNDQVIAHTGWQGPAMLGVDAQKDANANIQLIGGGLLTYRDFYSSNSEDWKSKLRQRAIEAKHIRDLADEYGVPVEDISSILPPGVPRTDAPLAGANGKPTVQDAVNGAVRANAGNVKS